MTSRWEQLPRPVGFVLAGGATLGALQVGMLRALGEVGLDPDVVVGTSVGALNGAVLADVGASAEAAEVLESLWGSLGTGDVFPGARLHQAWRVLRGHSIFPARGLRAVVTAALGPRPTFEQLTHPFGAVATNVLTGHPTVFAAGDLVGPLLASAAIPGVLPVQQLDGQPYWDGGVASDVPLLATERLGAASLVVLDPGDICARERVPRGLAAKSVAAFGAAIRQRVLVEVGGIASRMPVLYLDRPCVTGREPLSFGSTPRLLEEGAEVARRFLAEAAVPEAGRMSGAPHTHTHEDQVNGPHEPVFPRGHGRAELG